MTISCPSCLSRFVVPDQGPLTILCAFCGQWSVVFEGEAKKANGEASVFGKLTPEEQDEFWATWGTDS